MRKAETKKTTPKKKKPSAPTSNDNTNPSLTDHFPVGIKKDGHEFAPRTALKIALMHTLDEIRRDKRALVHEFISDSPAFSTAASAALAGSPLSAPYALVSSFAAGLLLVGLNFQRKANTREFKNFLKIWVKDNENRKEDEEKPVKERTADKELEKMIHHSGLSFEGLPESVDTRHFKKRKFQAIAQLLIPKTKTSHFLNSAIKINHFLEMPSNQKFKAIEKTIRNTASFIGNTGLDIIPKPWNAISYTKKICLGFSKSAQVFKKFNFLKNTRRNRTIPPVKELESLKGDYSQTKIYKKNPELITETQEIRKAEREHIGRTKAAAYSFSLQAAFMAAQTGDLVQNILTQNYNGAYWNAFSLSAAAGPWKAFAEELAEEFIKVSTKRTLIAARYAEIAGIKETNDITLDPK